MSRVKLIPLRLGAHVLVQNRTMASAQEAKVLRVYKRKARIRLPDGQEKVIHRQYILRQKIAKCRQGGS